MNMKSHMECPVAKTALLLSDTWTMLIIRDLLNKQMRFCEIEQSLEGISSRTLTLKLKQLESEKIIVKNDLYYTLSKQGQKLKNVIAAMEAWGKNIK